MSAEFKAGWNARGPEIAALTAQLQAAQATIADVLKIAPTWYRGMYGSPDDMIALTDLRRFLSDTDTSAYDAAIRAARVKELKDAADAAAEAWINGAWNLTVDTRQWLKDRAASIEQTEVQ